MEYPATVKFLQEAYSDSKLMALREAAVDGKVNMWDTRYCLLGRCDQGRKFWLYRHWFDGGYGCHPAEQEMMRVQGKLPWNWFQKRRVRRACDALLPLIDAEINRRANLNGIVHLTYHSLTVPPAETIIATRYCE